MVRALLVGLAVAAVVCADDLKPEVILLQRARVVMSKNLASLPNYTCTQTIERSERSGPKRKPRLIDVVRLEVALVDGKELFAWPGSNRFSDSSVTDMVKGGAIGNGGFALHAKALFQSAIPRFTYAGEVFSGSRRLHKWEYVVPQMLSGFQIKVGLNQAVVGYHGSILVDADSIDLVSLEIEADDLPPSLMLRGSSTRVEYARMEIGGERFLLPVSEELEMVAVNGAASVNLTRFSRCRQYSGESRILFDDPEPAALQSAGPVKVVEASGGVTLPLELAAAVTFQGVAVGDPVTAKLTSAVKLPDGTALPKGALVHGRLTGLRDQNFGRLSGRAVGLHFFAIEAPGVEVRFSGTLEDIQTAHPGFRNYGGLGRLRPENDRQLGSVFFVHTHVLQLPRGLRIVWRTEPPRGEENQ